MLVVNWSRREARLVTLTTEGVLALKTAMLSCSSGVSRGLAEAGRGASSSADAATAPPSARASAAAPPGAGGEASRGAAAAAVGAAPARCRRAAAGAPAPASCAHLRHGFAAPADRAGRSGSSGGPSQRWQAGTLRGGRSPHPPGHRASCWILCSARGAQRIAEAAASAMGNEWTPRWVGAGMAEACAMVRSNDSNVPCRRDGSYGGVLARYNARSMSSAGLAGRSAGAPCARALLDVVYCLGA
jgi:hypothetical protein